MTQRQRLWAAIPWAFLILGLSTSLVLVWSVPPFQAPDELTHMARADIIASGPSGLGETVQDGRRVLVGQAHVALQDASRPFQRLQAQPAEKVRWADIAYATSVGLDARRTAIFPGQALNPLLYAPISAAVAWGRHFGWDVLDTLYLARTLNAVVSLAIGFLALRLAAGARLPLFAFLMLPMSLDLMGSAVQDGPVIAVTALAVALLSRGMGEGRPLSGREVAAAAICLILVGMAKPPHVAFAVLLWLAPAERPRRKRLWALAALAIPLAWNAWVSATGWLPTSRPGAVMSTAGQAAFLLRHPESVWDVAQHTFAAAGKFYVQQFVGVLGWLDTPLTWTFYAAAYVMLALALLTPAAVGARGWAALRLAVAPLVVLVSGAVFGSLYLGWSPVGGPMVDGVQGRYFLPIALLLPLAFEGPRPLLGGPRAAEGLSVLLTAAVILFPLISLSCVEWAVIDRYYLQ